MDPGSTRNPRVAPTRIDPGSTPHRPPTKSTPRIDPKSTPDRPRIGPSSTPNAPQVHPISAPKQPNSTPTQPRVDPQSTPDRPRIDPTLGLGLGIVWPHPGSVRPARASSGPGLFQAWARLVHTWAPGGGGKQPEVWSTELGEDAAFQGPEPAGSVSLTGSHRLPRKIRRRRQFPLRVLIAHVGSLLAKVELDRAVSPQLWPRLGQPRSTSSFDGPFRITFG